MMRFDLHVHTNRHSACSTMDPFALIERARAELLHGIVITEHDYLWPDEELAELRAAAPDLVILSGIEITGRGGDVLVYGVTNPFTLPKGIDWPDLCAEVHRQGGVCVMAHPYRWGQPVDTILEQKKPHFDGVELMSSNMDDDLRQKAAALHARHPEWAGLGNSDGHYLDKVGMCHTLFEVDIRGIGDVVNAIRNRQTRAVACR